MPLGFGRSTFTYKAPAVAGSGAYAFADSDNTGTGNGATYNPYWSSPPLSNGTAMSFVIWIRLKDTTNATFDNGITRLISLSSDSFGSQVSINLSTSATGCYMNFLDTGGKNNIVNPTKSTGLGQNTASWQSNVINGEWHCFMTSLNQASATTNATWWIDSTDCTSINTGSTNRAFGHALGNMNYIRLRNMEYADTGTYGPWQGEGGKFFELGPIWVYNSYIDFNNSTNRSYFYNASNTDGFVDGGTDGTAGGAPTPNIYMYHDGTNLIGSPSFTSQNLVTKGSGSIRIISNTEGPGTGVTT
jgi:hypothetical protein